ncbi:hypothetical protein MTR67_035011 [Solanum verrucosum]|uniref:Uncharacterized protein n=1 Tax=Solanum verrucosum TaxID=315347 RepID=A0AAF0ZJD5_SOLVR|nr:hypothetical protein MTR67_035011 [Solanum verrucosum]
MDLMNRVFNKYLDISGVCSKDLESLRAWCSSRCVHQPQELKYVFTKKDFNLRQRRWLELLKDYNMSVLNQPGKENVVTDALSQLLVGSVSYVEDDKK